MKDSFPEKRTDSQVKTKKNSYPVSSNMQKFFQILCYHFPQRSHSCKKGSEETGYFNTPFSEPNLAYQGKNS